MISDTGYMGYYTEELLFKTKQMKTKICSNAQEILPVPKAGVSRWYTNVDSDYIMLSSSTVRQQ